MSLPYFLQEPKKGLEMLASDNYLVVDLETTNLEKGSCLNPDNSIVCTGVLCPAQDRAGVYWGNEYQLDNILKVIESSGFIVGHNLKFDLGWLRRAGLDLSKILIWDTMLGEYVIQGNKGKPLPWYGLDTVLSRYGLHGKSSVVSKLMKMGVCPSRMPKSWLDEYAAIDVEQTHKLFLKQRKAIIEDGLLPTLFTRCLYTPVLTDMEARGLHVDAERVQEAHREVFLEHKAIMAKLDNLTGGINPKSPKQVSEYLYGTLGFEELKNRKGEPLRSPKGGRKTDSDTIMALKATTKEQKEFKKLKKEQARLDAALDKTLTPLLKCVEGTDDHVLYANFNQCRTKSHRLSSSGRKYGVQFQNFNRLYKRLFSARRQGWSVAEADSEQIEFRCAGYLTKDPVIYQEVADKVDVHSISASYVFNIPLGEFTERIKNKEPEAKKLRTAAKSRTFLPLFGGIKGNPNEKAYFQMFRDKYQGVADTQREWVEEALVHKESRLQTGLKVFWPYVYKGQNGYIEGHTKVRNLPIQNLATGEIMPIAAVYLWHRLCTEGLKAFIINVIHDSCVAEVPYGEKEQYSVLAKRSFEDDVYFYLKEVYNIDFDMPLGTEIGFGKYWGED